MGVEEIRVVLVNLPLLAADLLEQAFAGEPGMVVVGRAGAPNDSIAPEQLLERAQGMDADVLVVGVSGTELPLALLAEQRMVKVLGIEAVHGTAHLYELRPCHVELGDLSPADVANEVKKATRRMRLA